MPKRLIYLLSGCLAIMGMLAACDDLEDKPYADTETPGEIAETGTAELYVLCEGLYNQNNSTLARYSFHTQSRTNGYFNAVNQRSLGDTANDLAIYGGKIYIVVNVSSTVEVIDFATGESMAQISMLNDNGTSRQPRYITFHQDKAYVCSYDGTVARIDTTSLEVEAFVPAGRNPDGICTQNGKLYVSNSGGLDYASSAGVDNTVSVIDIETFTETKKITVGPNPGRILADGDGSVYVVTRGEDISAGDYHLVRINATTDEVTARYDEPVLNFTIDKDSGIAYLYNYSYTTQETSFKTFDLSTGSVIGDFITDGTRINTPYGININPYSGNIYITDAYDYTTQGDVLCFNQQGELQFRLNYIGLNPNTVAFSDKASQSNIDDAEDADDAPAYADKVLAYCPAPGQFINTSTSAYEDGDTYEEVLEKATERIRSKSLVTLGGFGGYIVLGFPQSIPNVAGEYDFKVWSNAALNSSTATGKPGGSSEPGIVFVSQDTNGNGLADDEWYELAGSEYGKDTETRGYKITYERPNPLDADVHWTDNQGNEGYVYRNSYHSQSSYYPLWTDDEELTFSGTRLQDNAVLEDGIWVGYCYDWGYADNYPNDTAESNFKIDWAVNSQGEPVTLDAIDFVKITTAVNQYAGQMGELSTEIRTVQNLHYEEE